jgi:hypothetical protein
MNQGKRLIRRTVVGVYGAIALWVGANALALATVDASAGLRRVLSLGLARAPETERNPPVDLATVRDFTEVVVIGRFDVEITGADSYSASFTPAAGFGGEVNAYRNENELHVIAQPAEGAQSVIGTLRIATPALERIYANAGSLVISGLRVPELTITGLGNLGRVHLRQNQVAEWRLHSGDDDTVVWIDDATFAAGSWRATGVILRREE